MADEVQPGASREKLAIDLDVPSEARGIPEGEEGSFADPALDFEEDEELSLARDDAQMVGNAQLSE